MDAQRNPTMDFFLNIANLWFSFEYLIYSAPDFLTEIPNHKGIFSMQGSNLSWKVFNV